MTRREPCSPPPAARRRRRSQSSFGEGGFPDGGVRCAVYTRKSSDDGLEQELNSLDAQREACDAYILSQRHAGWVGVTERYDDGGLSGGTMERPGLRRLLADIAKGKIKTHKVNDQGKELITGLYKEGDFFGYPALLEEGRYHDAATTLEESEICMIPKDDFNNLVYRNAEVSRRFIKMLSDDLQEKEDQLIKLAYNSVRKRVAEALVTLANRYRKDDDKSFSMNISREDLANLAGTATETTIRTLSDFKDEALVDIKGGTITVLNYDKLAGMRN